LHLNSAVKFPARLAKRLSRPIIKEPNLPYIVERYVSGGLFLMKSEELKAR
jgi:hypothetical protein